MHPIMLASIENSLVQRKLLVCTFKNYFGCVAVLVEAIVTQRVPSSGGGGEERGRREERGRGEDGGRRGGGG